MSKGSVSALFISIATITGIASGIDMLSEDRPKIGSLEAVQETAITPDISKADEKELTLEELLAQPADITAYKYDFAASGLKTAHDSEYINNVAECFNTLTSYTDMSGTAHVVCLNNEGIRIASATMTNILGDGCSYDVDLLTREVTDIPCDQPVIPTI